jgi:putative transposase
MSVCIDSESRFVHELRYHFIWCPKYHHPVLNVLEGELRDRLDTLVRRKADDLDLEVLGVATRSDHVHLCVTGNPRLTPDEIVRPIKEDVSRRLRDEFDLGLPSLWTGSYFVSTAESIPRDAVEEYVDAQTGD